eukprot:6491799-Pyramimonas_sp.AAC.2
MHPFPLLGPDFLSPPGGFFGPRCGALSTRAHAPSVGALPCSAELGGRPFLLSARTSSLSLQRMSRQRSLFSLRCS